MTIPLAGAVVSTARCWGRAPEGCAHGNLFLDVILPVDSVGNPSPWCGSILWLTALHSWQGQTLLLPGECDPPRAHRSAQEQGPREGQAWVRNTGRYQAICNNMDGPGGRDATWISQTHKDIIYMWNLKKAELVERDSKIVVSRGWRNAGMLVKGHRLSVSR